MNTITPDPKKAKAGRAGMRARWGPPRHIDIRDCTPEQRRLIAALVETVKATFPATREEGAA